MDGEAAAAIDSLRCTVALIHIEHDRRDAARPQLRNQQPQKRCRQPLAATARNARPLLRTANPRETLREQVAALAVKGAEQILRREVNAGVHAELLTRLKTEL